VNHGVHWHSTETSRHKNRLQSDFSIAGRLIVRELLTCLVTKRLKNRSQSLTDSSLRRIRELNFKGLSRSTQRSTPWFCKVAFSTYALPACGFFRACRDLVLMSAPQWLEPRGVCGIEVRPKIQMFPQAPRIRYNRGTSPPSCSKRGPPNCCLARSLQKGMGVKSWLMIANRLGKSRKRTCSF
jgi:hypothetical protein